MFCQISDFDGDGFLGPSDIENAVKSLTQNELKHDEIESIWEKVHKYIQCSEDHNKPITLYYIKQRVR